MGVSQADIDKWRGYAMRGFNPLLADELIMLLDALEAVKAELAITRLDRDALAMVLVHRSVSIPGEEYYDKVKGCWTNASSKCDDCPRYNCDWQGDCKPNSTARWLDWVAARRERGA